MIARLSRALVAALACLATGSLGGPAQASPEILAGTVTYRERMALPPQAVVEVKLVDVSVADEPGVVIAEARARSGAQVPIAYRLEFERDRIVPGRTYALQARILVDNLPWFATTQRHLVFADGRNTTDLVLQRVEARSDGAEAASPLGRWVAQSIRGAGVLDRIRSMIDIGADGSLSGDGGCNSFKGEVTIAGDRMTFGEVTRTLKACPPAVMQQEARFLAALADVRSWRADADNRQLELIDAEGRVVAFLARS